MSSVSETESKSNGRQPRGDERHGPTSDSKSMNGREKPKRATELALLIPSQTAGWTVPPELRRDAIGELWRIIRSRRIKADVKIRAIETLVRIDQQALASERQEDWRSVQTSNANRSNVRVLAELHRNKSAAKSLSKPNK